MERREKRSVDRRERRRRGEERIQVKKRIVKKREKGMEKENEKVWFFFLPNMRVFKFYYMF